MDKIVCGPEPLHATHSFVRDRTRSVRQDFTLQNDRGVHAIECHERIARYHILCLHQLCEIKGFSQQQEMEQLRKVLQSLTEFYHDAKVNRIECPNEAEFRAYHLLSSLRDPDMARQAQALPITLFLSQPIQYACQLIKLSNRNNEVVGRLKASNCEAALNQFCQFFKTVDGAQTDYLTACLLETNFVDIRKGALKAMRKAYLDRQRPFPARELAAMLGCDSELQVEEICIHYKLEIEVDTSGKAVAVKLHNRSSWDESVSAMQQQFSHRIVEAKRHGRAYNVIINRSISSTTSKLNPLAQDFTPPEPKPSNATVTVISSPNNVLSPFPQSFINSQPNMFNFSPAPSPTAQLNGQPLSTLKTSPSKSKSPLSQTMSKSIAKNENKRREEAERQTRQRDDRQKTINSLALEIFYNQLRSTAIQEISMVMAETMHAKTCLHFALKELSRKAHRLHLRQEENERLRQLDIERKHQYSQVMSRLDRRNCNSERPLRNNHRRSWAQQSQITTKLKKVIIRF